MAQLVPAVIGGLLWRRMTVAGAAAGIVVGWAIVCPLALLGNDPFLGINAGLIGLAANVTISRARPERPRPESGFSGRQGR